MNTKSLYNIAGFLGAQSRSNPSDHGDSWDSHKSARMQSPVQECVDSPAFIEQLYQECLEIVANQPKLTPIDTLTISVGDTVKLVGNQAINSGFGQNLTIGNYYKVVRVDATDEKMPIQIADDANDLIWMFATDMLQVI